ncbi:MAG: trigger factor [Gammaproteobacteria bacterium]|nr:trigger factor [Gammaproteobacteria bacterium]
MQVSVESISTLERKITVQVPSTRIDDAVDSKLKELSRTVRMDGFRAGKVPMKVIKQKFSGQVRQDVVGEVLQSTLYEAINQENLKPAEGPKVGDVKMEPGSDLEYSASFDVYPEITLASLDGKTIEQVVASVEDSDLDKMFEKLQTQRVTWESVDRAAEEADQIIITFEGRIDGEPFDGGKADQDFPLVLGSESMIPGFETQLIGAKEGETKTIEVTFPDDYQGKEVAGKKAEFDVVIKKVNKPVLPEVNDEFAKEFGVSEGLEAFKVEVRNNMNRELAARLQAQKKNVVMELLLEVNDIEVPKALVDNEVEALIKQAIGNNPQSMKNASLPKELFLDQASKRVKLGLLVGEVIQANDIKVDKSRVKAKLEEVSGTYEHPAAVIKAYTESAELMQSLEGLVMEDQVVELLSSQVTVSEKNMAFDEIMNENPSA